MECPSGRFVVSRGFKMISANLELLLRLFKLVALLRAIAFKE